MDTPDPLEDFKSPGPTSSKTLHVAGILTTVYGLDELPKNCKSVSCLWLLHGRLQKKEVMAGVADMCIRAWNQRPSSDPKVGFIAVAFDQRNHGTREVHPSANRSWKEGNETHAQDMFRFTSLFSVLCCNRSDKMQYPSWHSNGCQSADRPPGLVCIPWP